MTIKYIHSDGGGLPEKNAMFSWFKKLNTYYKHNNLKPLMSFMNLDNPVISEAILREPCMIFEAVSIYKEHDGEISEHLIINFMN